MSKTLHQIALENLKAQGLTEGSKVKVIAKAESRTGGWTNSWVDTMDQAVGKIFEITSISKDDSGVDIVVNPGSCSFGFPAFCLELIPRKVSMKLNDNYTADVYHQERVVKVGCQEFPFYVIKELYELTKNA